MEDRRPADETADLPRLVSYAPRFSVRPGDTLPIMVSSAVGPYRAEVVHLVSGERERDGTGYREDVATSIPASAHPGRRQPLRRGSCIEVPDHPALHLAGAFTL